MKKSKMFASLAIPAAAVGLLAQDTVVIRQGSKTADEAVFMAQTGAGAVGFAGEPMNFKFITQEFSFNGRVVTNAPYAAEEKTESVQTLADGTHITNATTARVYRDSQGRTRRELSMPGPGDNPHTMIWINDPVSGANYTLDPQAKVAHQMPGPAIAAKFKMAAEAEAKARELRASGGAMEYHVVRSGGAGNGKHEDLGGNVMEGVSVTGTRETSTIEAGKMGNDRPITITSERWYSPELQVEVKSVHNDPRMGQTTHTLTNISRSEPDSSLFQVPPEYKLDEGSKTGFQRTFEVHTSH